MPAGDALGQEAFPDLRPGGASPAGIEPLNQQANSLINSDATIGGRKQDRSLLAVKEGCKAEIHSQQRITPSGLACPNEPAAPAVEAPDAGMGLLSKSTNTLGGNPKAVYQLGLWAKLLEPGNQRQSPFGSLHCLEAILSHQIRQPLAERTARDSQPLLGISLDKRKAGKEPGTAGMACHGKPAFLPGLGCREEM